MNARDELDAAVDTLVSKAGYHAAKDIDYYWPSIRDAILASGLADRLRAEGAAELLVDMPDNVTVAELRHAIALSEVGR